jgi:hypothetical protein
MSTELISDNFSKEQWFFSDSTHSFSCFYHHNVRNNPVSLHTPYIGIASSCHLAFHRQSGGKYGGFCRLIYKNPSCENAKM